jgi:transcriptional/translational regulatory protein YebC/TACO1
MDIVLEHGGEDLNDEGDTWEIITDPGRMKRCQCRQGGQDSHGDERSDHGRLDLYQARRQRGQPDDSLLEALEDCDDTQNVYSNFDMDAEQMEHAAG